MDIERTMEFRLDQHARSHSLLAEWIHSQAKPVKSEAQLTAPRQESQRQSEIRGAAVDRRLDWLERNLTGLAELGMKTRRKSNRKLEDHEKRFHDMQPLMAGIGGNVLIGCIDHLSRNPPQS